MPGAKRYEQSQARLLRHRGWSVKRIAHELHVSQASVSAWVRDIQLTQAQIEALNAYRRPGQPGPGGLARARQAKEVRDAAMERGRSLAQTSDAFRMLCMLHWGEGSKSSACALEVHNSDPLLVRTYLSLSRQVFDVTDAQITLKVHKHAGSVRREDAERAWLMFLGLEPSALRRGNDKPPGGTRGETLPYGTCVLKVGRQESLLTVLGGIQAIGGFEREVWSQPSRPSIREAQAPLAGLDLLAHTGAEASSSDDAA